MNNNSINSKLQVQLANSLLDLSKNIMYDATSPLDLGCGPENIYKNTKLCVKILDLLLNIYKIHLHYFIV